MPLKNRMVFSWLLSSDMHSARGAGIRCKNISHSLKRMSRKPVHSNKQCWTVLTTDKSHVEQYVAVLMLSSKLCRPVTSLAMSMHFLLHWGYLLECTHQGHNLQRKTEFLYNSRCSYMVNVSLCLFQSACVKCTLILKLLFPNANSMKYIAS